MFAVSDLKSAQKLWFLALKSLVFIKICSFHQNLRFSSKSMFIVKTAVFRFLKTAVFTKNVTWPGYMVYGQSYADHMTENLPWQFTVGHADFCMPFCNLTFLPFL